MTLRAPTNRLLCTCLILVMPHLMQSGCKHAITSSDETLPYIADGSSVPEIWAWPAPHSLVRFHPVKGISVLAPAGTPNRSEPPRNLELPHRVTFYWEENAYGRHLELEVRYDLPVDEQAPEAQRVQVALRELVPPEQPLEELRPFQSKPYPGFAYDENWEGMLVRRRIFVVGRTRVMLMTASPIGDPFPEADLFFRSVVIDPQLIQDSSGIKNLPPLAIRVHGDLANALQAAREDFAAFLAEEDKRRTSHTDMTRCMSDINHYIFSINVINNLYKLSIEPDGRCTAPPGTTNSEYLGAAVGGGARYLVEPVTLRIVTRELGE